MPLEGKRVAEYLTNASPSKHIKPPESYQEGSSKSSRDASESSLCARCSELKIPPNILAPKILFERKTVPDFSNLVVQRLLFDTHRPLSPTCKACIRLELMSRTGITVRSSRINQRGLPRTECLELDSKSWFEVKGKEIFRYTGKGDSDIFSKGSFSRDGNGHWKRETFHPYDPTSLPHRAKQVLPHPHYAAIKAWIDHCSENHPKCQPRQSDKLSLISLIDVNTRRLVPYPPNTETKCEYMALSYVWGDSKSPIEKLGEIPKVLPRTIEDTIIVVKELGKNYLWVDSICIDQTNAEKKIAQIKIMDIIYECAFATIIALVAENADGGLPGVGSVSRIPQIVVEFGKNSVIDKLPSLGDQLERSSWAKRAWTYQEGLLSRRRLLFAKHQLYFCYNEMEYCESQDDEASFRLSSWQESLETDEGSDSEDDLNEGLPRYIKDPFLVHNLQNQPFYKKVKLYEDIVNTYSPRQLSQDDDSLNAISALLRSLHRLIFAGGFLYGLPLVAFRSSILWRQSDNYFDSRFHDLLNKTTRRDVPNIPSWTWAAWKLLQPIELPATDDWSHQVQAPLTVMSREGKAVSLDLEVIDERHSQLEETRTSEETLADKEVTVQMISDTHAFYKKARAQGTRDSSILPNNTAPRDCCLLIEGILLSFPCTVSSDSIPFRGRQARIPVPSLGLPYSVDVIWQNDGYISEIAPPGGEETRRHDFLLASVLLYEPGGMELELELELLHLYWREGVAFRGGVVSIRLMPEKVARFWEECDARFCRFWFG
jgi:hypothetical protein